jgi:hypothetical protein
MPITSPQTQFYNFDRDYSSLPPINLPIRVVDPATRESKWGGLSAIPGFANEQYTFKIFPDFYGTDLNGISASPLADSYRYFIDLGDGTISTDLTAYHYYKYPGDYRVTLVAVDSAANFYSVVTRPTISISNAIPDKLFLTYQEGSSALNSSLKNPIILTRFNSYQSWPAVSADGGYSINLSVSGNKSKATTNTDYYSDINAHLKLFSGFVQIEDDGEGLVTDSVKTSNSFIYGKLNTASSTPPYFLYNEYQDGTIFLGTSGSTSFYYYED